ncbi:hypothetical protein [Spongiimicrobium sp. 3-5]|uniref:hypothetical protein n=1 Tax=Spongiimicrobium sp. 3-5 TaxID=3332596 RepID=UPI003980CAAB
MIEKELILIAYDHYPRNVDSISDKDSYILSKQHRKLLDKIERHNKPYSKNIVGLIEELKLLGAKEFDFNDATYFDWQDRCFTFEFIKNIGDKVLILKFYKSIIAPYFSIQYFQSKEVDNSNRYLMISKVEFDQADFVNGICKIANKHELKKLPLDLIRKKVPDINFDDIRMGKFTYFNVLFNSQTF